MWNEVTTWSKPAALSEMVKGVETNPDVTVDLFLRLSERHLKQCKARRDNMAMYGTHLESWKKAWQSSLGLGFCGHSNWFFGRRWSQSFNGWWTFPSVNYPCSTLLCGQFTGPLSRWVEMFCAPLRWFQRQDRIFSLLPRKNLYILLRLRTPWACCCTCRVAQLWFVQLFRSSSFKKTFASYLYEQDDM